MVFWVVSVCGGWRVFVLSGHNIGSVVSHDDIK